MLTVGKDRLGKKYAYLNPNEKYYGRTYKEAVRNAREGIQFKLSVAQNKVRSLERQLLEIDAAEPLPKPITLEQYQKLPKGSEYFVYVVYSEHCQKRWKLHSDGSTDTFEQMPRSEEMKCTDRVFFSDEELARKYARISFARWQLELLELEEVALDLPATHGNSHKA